MKKGGSQKEKLLMDASMEAKWPPGVKTWVRRVVEAAGVLMSANADGKGVLAGGVWRWL